jgi:NADP-dependent 3-hydroxy acid dehydrogenase YdfG
MASCSGKQGESTARHLADLGASVVLGARRKDRLDAIVKDITAKGGKALAVTVDVTKRDQVDSLIQEALNTHGKCRLQLNRRLGHFRARFLQLNRRLNLLFAAKA